ncbi:MAG: 50S ribosomal protein L17 [Bdellovibrionales bacterium]
MRHHAIKHTFGRKTGPRIALLRGLVSSLVEHGRIKTTVKKAKELRRHVERAVTMGKNQNVHARRVLMARYPNPKTVELLVGSLAERFAKRPGGYTRIVKLGPRPGDNADMAYIEFVDFAPAKAEAPDAVKGDKGAVKRAKVAGKQVAKKAKTAKKKKVASKRST